jgi:transcriptional regulator with XRE-family HTH domain
MKIDLKRQIGVRVRAAREKAGLTQEELAHLVNRDKDSVSLIERGRTVPTLQMLLDLSAGLKIGLLDLVPTEPVRKSEKRLKLEAEVIGLLADLSDDRLRYIRDQVASLVGLK